MDNCEFKPICNNDCEACEIKAEQEQIAKAAAAMEEIKNAIVKAFNPFFDEAIKTISALLDAIINAYPNKRVVNLAVNGKKARTRKKNKNRIYKWINKGGNNG